MRKKSMKFAKKENKNLKKKKKKKKAIKFMNLEPITLEEQLDRSSRSSKSSEIIIVEEKNLPRKDLYKFKKRRVNYLIVESAYSKENMDFQLLKK